MPIRDSQQPISPILPGKLTCPLKINGWKMYDPKGNSPFLGTSWKTKCRLFWSLGKSAVYRFVHVHGCLWNEAYSEQKVNIDQHKRI